MNERPDILEKALAKTTGPIDWYSPLANDSFAEYRDQDALDLVGVTPHLETLSAYWPRGGPQWDALGVTKSGAPVLVEAKAHIGELRSGGIKAGPESRVMIEAALLRVQEYVQARPLIPWTGALYQYANRLAHLYFLKTLNHLPAYLLWVYFTGDAERKGPTSIDQWQVAIALVHRELGIERHPFGDRSVEVFVDVAELA